jgi:hypothetical protein
MQSSKLNTHIHWRWIRLLIGKVVREGQIKNGKILSSPESTESEFREKKPVSRPVFPGVGKLGKVMIK